MEGRGGGRIKTPFEWVLGRLKWRYLIVWEEEIDGYWMMMPDPVKFHPVRSLGTGMLEMDEWMSSLDSDTDRKAKLRVNA